MKYKSILIELLLLIFVVVTLVNPIITMHNNKPRPQVNNGVLDLTDWNFKEDGIFRLNGSWEFYWGQLLTFEDFREGNKQSLSGYYNVPNVWNNYQVDGRGLPGQGYGTYRLRVKTDNINDLKGLKILTMSTAYKIMVDDKVIAENGTVGKSKGTSIPEYRPLAVTFENKDKDFDIIVQISNFIYSRGGFWYPAYLGTDRQIIEIKEKMSINDAILISVLFIMALYHLNIYLRRRQNTPALYFSLMLFLGVIRVAVTGECLINNFFSSMDFRVKVFLEYFSMLWGTTAFSMFIGELFKEETSKVVLNIFAFIVAVITIFNIVVPIEIYTRYILYYEGLLIIMMCYSIFSVLKAIKRKKEGALRFLIGIIIFLLTFVSDVLFHANIIVNIDKPVTAIFGFYIVYLQSDILAQRFSNSFEKVETLSKKLLSLDKLKDEFLTAALKNEMAFLQSQIKPHFLYNALNSISTLCISDGEKASALIDELSIYLRRCFRGFSDKSLIPLESEIELVKVYLNIEKARFGEKLNIEYDIDANVKCMLPPLVIQPLVENAVVHGLMKQLAGGRVKIAVNNHQDNIVIKIEDNGVGIPYATQKDLLNGSKANKGVGLANIHKRLLNIYGQGLNIESVEGQGTKISFIIPKNVWI